MEFQFVQEEMKCEIFVLLDFSLRVNELDHKMTDIVNVCASTYKS